MNKKISLFILLFFIFLTNSVHAQFNGFSYQTAIANNNGIPYGNKNINMRFSILKDAVNGAVLYVETQSFTTNNVGIINHIIGSGTVASGSFSTQIFGDSKLFLKVEVDLDKNGNYVFLNTLPLSAVPFAFYANAAKPIGSAGGDLSGTYPTPGIRDNVINSIKIQNGAVTKEKLADGILPDSLPPVGQAGGDLIGTYPSPWIKDNVINSNKIQNAAITKEKLADGILPDSLPPVGQAGGDLIGTYPSPWIKDNVINSNKIQNAAITKEKLAEGILPDSLPPIGTAGGDLYGKFPKPGVNGIWGRKISNLKPNDGQILKWSESLNEWALADDRATGIDSNVTIGDFFQKNDITLFPANNERIALRSLKNAEAPLHVGGTVNGYYQIWDAPNYDPLKGYERYYHGAQQFDGVNSDERPNVVFFRGYNAFPNGARVNPNEAGFQFREETHYEIYGTPHFEFHLPELYANDGSWHRLHSIYATKTNGLAFQDFHINQTNFRDVTGFEYLNFGKNQAGSGGLTFNSNSSKGEFFSIGISEVDNTNNGNGGGYSLGYNSGAFAETQFFTGAPAGKDTKLSFRAKNFSLNQDYAANANGRFAVYHNLNIIGNARMVLGKYGVLNQGVFPEASWEKVNDYAVIEIRDDSKGFLNARLTKTQREAINAAPAGLQIYQSDQNQGLFIKTTNGWNKVVTENQGLVMPVIQTNSSTPLLLTSNDYVVIISKIEHTIVLPDAASNQGRIYKLVNNNTGGNVVISAVSYNGNIVTEFPNNAKWTVQSTGNIWIVIED